MKQSRPPEFHAGVLPVSRDWPTIERTLETHFGAIETAEAEVWIFRGQSEPRFPETSFRRTVARFHDPRSLASETALRRLEAGILREFKRHARQYLPNAPDPRDELDWLALMRHHGAANRLLDWTYSPYVALYLACRSGVDRHGREGRFTVWAVNASACRRAANRTLARHDDEDVLAQDGTLESWRRFRERVVENAPGHAFAYPVNPYMLNERLTIQQGTFLCPSVLSLSVEKIFSRMFPDPQEQAAQVKRWEVRLSRDSLRDVLIHLYRMNMDSATLFPGLEGIAGALNTRIALPWFSA